MNLHTPFHSFEKECCGRWEPVNASLEQFWSFYWHHRNMSGPRGHGVKAHGHPFTWAWIHRDITFFSSGTSPFLASNLPCRHGKIFVEFPGRNMEYWSENAVIRGNDNCRCPVTGPMISCRFLHVWRMCLYPQVPYYLGHAFKSWVALGDLATRRFSPRLISKAN